MKGKLFSTPSIRILLFVNEKEVSPKLRKRKNALFSSAELTPKHYPRIFLDQRLSSRFF